MNKRITFLLPVSVFLISFSIYVYTLNPSISAADSNEIVTTAIVLGVPHQPSYPVNTILGHFFSKIPFGPLPWRVNLMSAFFQAATVTLMYFVILKLYKGGGFGGDGGNGGNGVEENGKYFLAAAASFFLAFALTFWQYATRAEVFPFNNFLAASLLFVLLSWFETRSAHFLYLFFFLCGFAFTHHQTVIFFGPAFLFLLVLGGMKFWWPKKKILIILLALGLVPYFVLLISLARANPPIKWGEPSNLKGAVRALTRSDYGTFSPYAQHPSEYEMTRRKETPVDQQVFYFKSLNQDFSFIGLLLAILGGIYLFREKRKVFSFLFLGFFFVGPFFLGFANWTLESGFHQAIVKRFQMLPDLYFTLFLAFGLFFLWEKFCSLKLNLKERKNYLTTLLVLLFLFSLFLFPLVRNFKDADNRANNMTLTYARDSLTGVPQDAIVLISGDVTTFAFEFWHTLVEPDQKRIVFSPGLLYLDWYVARLRKNHPEITIPPTLSGRIQPSTTQIVDANWGKRPIYISPELARYDPEVGEKYVLWPKHLLFLVKKKGEDLRLEPYREENDRLWQSLNLPLMEKVRKTNPLLEYAMVPEYARHFFNIGAVFESVHLYDDALREYYRALKIHPAFPDPYKNLGRIYGFRLKEKDYQKAFENFNTFLATALPSQEADVEAVREAMGTLQQELAAEATRSAQMPEATAGAKLEEASFSGKLEE